jgi:hypothetical protein
MSFRKHIGEKKFGKNDFYTLQGTMFHRPLPNTSSLKITAAYSAILYEYMQIQKYIRYLVTVKNFFI